jgi:hypothetical protein
VEQLPGTRSSHQESKAACSRRRDQKEHEPLEPSRCRPSGQASQGTLGALETSEQNQQSAASRQKAMKCLRYCRQPSATIAFWMRPAIRTAQKIPMARKAQPRFRRSKAEAELSGS